MCKHIFNSFDLHVLSTPPAFILSQDRTLEFVSPFQGFVSKSSIRPVTLALASLFLSVLYLFVLFAFKPFCFSENLLNFQGRIAVYFSRCHVVHIPEPHRRRRDLNPRAGYPTYRISSADPSATWVLLRDLRRSLKKFFINWLHSSPRTPARISGS